VKRLGPELKMPKLKGGEMKVPPFLSDLYVDLRDRRLLPLVALLLVAIVATPILLAGGSDEPEAVSPPLGAVGGSDAQASSQNLNVVQAQPGLRNYKKRLAHRTPTNPFKQRFNGPTGLKGAQLQSQTATSETSTPTSETSSSESSTTFESSETTVTVPSNGAGGGSSGGGGGTGGGANSDGLPDGATIFTLEVTLQITRIETKPDGTVDKNGPTLYKDVQAPAPLPGEKTPVITYLGMGSKDRVPMFLVSNEVTGIFGEANCISGAKTCQLLVLEEGFPVTFVYGENDVRYKINLIKAEPVITGHS
jgi:hypothetical protein